MENENQSESLISQTEQAPAGKQPSEEGRFEDKTPEKTPELPEKFMKDGKPDYEAMTASYTELEGQLRKNKDELLEDAKADMFKDRPEKAEDYEVKDIEGVNMDELKGNSMFEWWKNEAHSKGLSQEDFDTSVQEYIKSITPDYEKEMKELGDNSKQRVAAVATFMGKYKDDPATYAQLDKMAYTADGIKTIEKLMKSGSFEVDENVEPEPSITAEELKTMQSDPRYWDTARRDPAFVKKVTDGYAKLYGEK